MVIARQQSVCRSGQWAVGVIATLTLVWTVVLGAAFGQSSRQKVSLELVLAIDVSASVNTVEFDLQLRGIARALRQRQTIDLIAQHSDGVAVTIAQWSGWADGGRPAEWRILTDEASVLRYAHDVEGLDRRQVGYLTAIGYAIDFSIDLIEGNRFNGRLRKIDVSGDGRSNAGVEAADARDRALARGMAISGLAIETDDSELSNYFRQNVIGGPGAFVITASTYGHFAEAMAKKLARELTIYTADAAAGSPSTR